MAFKLFLVAERSVGFFQGENLQLLMFVFLFLICFEWACQDL